MKPGLKSREEPVPVRELLALFPLISFRGKPFAGSVNDYRSRNRLPPTARVAHAGTLLIFSQARLLPGPEGQPTLTVHRSSASEIRLHSANAGGDPPLASGPSLPTIAKDPAPLRHPPELASRKWIRPPLRTRNAPSWL